MNPKNIQVIGSELAIAWDDGAESYVGLEKLRRHCPCALCSGETDAMGRLHKPPAPTYQPSSFQVKRFQAVGGYAVNFAWGDGHDSGIYTFGYLKKLGGTE